MSKNVNKWYLVLNILADSSCPPNVLLSYGYARPALVEEYNHKKRGGGGEATINRQNFTYQNCFMDKKFAKFEKVLRSVYTERERGLATLV